MTTFAHPYPLPVGDFLFGTCFDEIGLTPSSSGCLTTLPPYRISTDFPQPRSSTAFKPARNPVADASFFGEAISASLTSTQVDFCFSLCTPQQVTHAEKPKDPELLKAVEGGQTPPRRPQTPPKPQRASAKLEGEVSEPIAGESKRKKRGRKPKGARKGSSEAPKIEHSDGEVNPRDPRRRHILERNRIAATKCRLRKRAEASELASREQAMEHQNRNLSSIFDQLTAEIYLLKTQLLRHTDCNCVLIQKYIAHEARKSVNGLPSFPSPFQPNVAPLTGYKPGLSGSVTDSHGIRMPDMESVPSTWAGPSQQNSRPPEVGADVLDMVLEPIQKQPIPVSCQPISSILSMLECCYRGTCVGTGVKLHPSDGVFCSDDVFSSDVGLP